MKSGFLLASLVCVSGLGLFGATGEAKTISGDYAVAEGGETYAIVTVSATATITGGALTVEEGIVVSSGCAATFNNAGVVLGGSGEVALDVKDNASYDGTAVISGAATFVIRGNGAVSLRGDNTFTGACIATNKTLDVWSDTAFGATVGKTTLNYRWDAKAVCTFHGVTLEETFAELVTQHDASHYVADGTATFNGNIEKVSNSLCQFGGVNDGKLYLNGVVNCDQWFTPKNTVDIILNDSTKASYYAQLNVGGSLLHVNYPVKITDQGTLGEVAYKSSSGKVYLACDDAFYTTSTAATAVGGWSTVCFHICDGLLDVGSTTQHLKSLNSYQDNAEVTGGAGSEVITYQVPAKGLMMTPYTPNQPIPGFAGKFTGAVSLTVDGTYRDNANYRPFLLCGAKSTSTGVLTVTNGATLCISNDAYWAGETIRVAGTDSVLEVRNATPFPKTAEICLSGGGKIRFAEGCAFEIRATNLSFDGAKQYAGTWGSLDNKTVDYRTAQIEGPGYLLVSGSAETGVWTGGGADTKFSTKENWQGGVVMEHRGGLSKLRIVGGTGITFDDKTVLAGISYEATLEGGFAFAQEGAGSLSLYDGGVVMSAGGTAARQLTFDLPVTLRGAVTNVVPNATDSLAFRQPIDGDEVSLVKTGVGEFLLPPGSTFAGSVDIRDCPFLLTGDGQFGAAGNTAKIASTDLSHELTISNAVVRQDLTITPPDSNNNWGEVVTRTTNVFAGKLTFKQNCRLQVKTAAALVCEGGLDTTSSAYFLPVFGTGSSLVITNTSVAFRNAGPSFSTTSGTVVFAVPTTHAGYLQFNGRDLTVRATVPYAFDTALNTSYFSFNDAAAAVTLDISGGDQQVGEFGFKNSGRAKADPAPNSQITSSSPARLFVDQYKSDYDTWASPFTGCAGLVKGGAKELDFANCVNTSTGPLEVTAGTLGFLSDSSWKSASEVRLTGGTLRVTADGQFGRRTDWYVDQGKVEIPSGVTVRCRNLYRKVGDAWVLQETGAYTTGFVTGGGTLQSCGGGMMLFVR